jgi:hypothetical protein
MMTIDGADMQGTQGIVIGETRPFRIRRHFVTGVR